jgi:hypothetical protein
MANVVECLEEGQRAARKAPATRDAGGGDEDKPLRLFESGGRQLGGDEAAERVAGELDAFEAYGVEPAAEPFAQLGGAYRIAEARKINHVQAAPSGK